MPTYIFIYVSFPLWSPRGETLLVKCGLFQFICKNLLEYVLFSYCTFYSMIDQYCIFRILTLFCADLQNPLLHPNVMNQHNFHHHTSLSQHQILVLGNNRPMASTSAPKPPQQPVPRSQGCINSWLFKYKERSKRIDVVSRLVFPVGFFIFNCVYWTVYMMWLLNCFTVHIVLYYSILRLAFMFTSTYYRTFYNGTSVYFLTVYMVLQYLYKRTVLQFPVYCVTVNKRTVYLSVLNVFQYTFVFTQGLTVLQCANYC